LEQFFRGRGQKTIFNELLKMSWQVPYKRV
jgi:hypothetical protein